MKKSLIKVLSTALIISMCFTGTVFSGELTDVETGGEYSAEAAGITEGSDFIEVTDITDAVESIEPEDLAEELAIAEVPAVDELSDTVEVPIVEEQEEPAEEPFIFEEVIESDTVISEEEVLEIPVEEIPQQLDPVSEEEPATVVQTEEMPLEILLEEVVEETEMELEELNETDNSPLYYGMTSYGVYYLQKALRNKGYETPADGYFGVDTAVAVAVFQMYNGLSVTGVADETVQELIQGKCVNYYSFGKGTVSRAVASMQSLLKDLGYLYAVIDGDFGSYTEDAVKQFQKNNGLYVDGYVGMQTLKALLRNPKAASGSIALPLKELSRGDSGSDVKKLQKRLIEMGYLNRTADGKFDAYTQYAVALFQLYNDLTLTGSVDTKMIEVMNSTSAQSYRQITSGVGGKPVRGLQRLLQKLGYNVGILDGDFGNITRKAVLMFQRINGLFPDGVVGPLTIYSLLIDPLPYDPDAELEYTEVELMAMEVLDRVGWDLYSAFEWSVGMSYNLELDIGYTTSGTAMYSYRNYYGNCISMATTFYWMARMLGYSVRTIYGSVPYRSGGSGPHAWVEIDINGGTYICDPDFEMQTGNNGYMIYYGQSGTWRYQYGYILSDY